MYEKFSSMSGCVYKMHDLQVWNRASYRSTGVIVRIMSSSRIHIVAASILALIARTVTLQVLTSDMHFTMAKSNSSPTYPTDGAANKVPPLCASVRFRIVVLTTGITVATLCLPLSAFTSSWSPAIQLCDRLESAKGHDRRGNSRKRDVEAKETTINHQLPRSRTVNHLR